MEFSNSDNTNRDSRYLTMSFLSPICFPISYISHILDPFFFNNQLCCALHIYTEFYLGTALSEAVPC